MENLRFRQLRPVGKAKLDIGFEVSKLHWKTRGCMTGAALIECPPISSYERHRGITRRRMEKVSRSSATSSFMHCQALAVYTNA